MVLKPIQFSNNTITGHNLDMKKGVLCFPGESISYAPVICIPPPPRGAEDIGDIAGLNAGQPLMSPGSAGDLLDLISCQCMITLIQIRYELYF